MIPEVLKPSDGVFIGIGSGAIASLCTLAGAWIKARYSSTQIKPQPIGVREDRPPTGAAVCDERHSRLDGQITELFTRTNETTRQVARLDELSKRLDSMDRKLDEIIKKL